MEIDGKDIVFLLSKIEMLAYVISTRLTFPSITSCSFLGRCMSTQILFTNGLHIIHTIELVLLNELNQVITFYIVGNAAKLLLRYSINLKMDFEFGRKSAL